MRFTSASLPVLVSALLLAACASLPTEAPADPSLLRLGGSVRHAQGMAPPQGATLRVALHDLSRPDKFPRVVAYQDTWPGRRAPYPFLLQLDRALLDPARTYGLSAQVFDAEARLIWATDEMQPVSTESPGAVGLVVRGTSERTEELPSARATAVPVPEPIPMPAPEAPADAVPPVPTRTGKRTMSFDCEGLAVTVHVEDTRVRLVLPDRTLVLARVQGRAGEEYGHPGAIVRLRGEALFLELGGKVHRSCEPRAP